MECCRLVRRKLYCWTSDRNVSCFMKFNKSTSSNSITYESHTHTHTHAHTHTHTRTHAHTHMHTHMHTHIKRVGLRAAESCLNMANTDSLRVMWDTHTHTYTAHHTHTHKHTADTPRHYNT